MMIRCFLLLLLFVAGQSMGLAEESNGRKVTFLPQWIPQSQFAGYYVAYEKGIYQKYDLDVTLLRGGPERPALHALESGEADFASTFLSTAIESRARNMRIKNICQLVQKSSLVLVSKKDSGIDCPEKFQGKKISIWPDFAVQPTALFRKFNLDVTIIPQTYTLTLFLRGGVDVASAMWYNEYHTLLNSGYNEEELNLFFYHDYGLNFPEDGIYCLEETLLRDRPLCQDFVRASIEGWRYAFEHPDEAVDIVLAYVAEANLPTTRVHQEWMLARMKDIMLPKDRDIPLGSLSQDDYTVVATELLQSGSIDNIPNYSEFYENCATQSQEK